MLLDNNNHSNRQSSAVDILKSKDKETHAHVATPFEQRVNEVIASSASSRALGEYPSNVTSMYRGEYQGTVFVAANASKVVGVAGGRLLMQLHSETIVNIPSISFVYGVLKLYDYGMGENGKDSIGDHLYPLQGVFLSTEGTLTLFSSPFVNQKLFLEVSVGFRISGGLKTKRSWPLFCHFERCYTTAPRFSR